MIKRESIEILTTVIPMYALELADSRNVISKYVEEHGATLPEELRTALQRAEIALFLEFEGQIKPTIKQLGLGFWAEIFGIEGSRCEHCKEGLCTEAPEDTDGVLLSDFCGYCYPYHEEATGKVWHVCVKTHRATSSGRSLPFTS